MFVLFTTLGKNVWVSVGVFVWVWASLFSLLSRFLYFGCKVFLVFLRWCGECRAMNSPRCLPVICVGGISGGSAVVFSL